MKHTMRRALLVGSGLAVLLSGPPAPSVQSQQASGRAAREGDAELERPPVPSDDNEKKVLGILDDILANQSFRNVPPEDGRLLRIFAESIEAKHIVEIGTSTGYSAIWMGLALQKTGGKLTTYEIDEGRASTAQNNFDRAAWPTSSRSCWGMRTKRSPH